MDHKPTDELDDFISSMQEEIDRKDREDFSEYALNLARDLQHQGKLEIAEDVLIHEWRGPCGDSVKWYLKLHSGNVSHALFLTNGCTTADIASEQTARMIEGQPIKKIREISPADVLKGLQKFPEDSAHCATLAVQSLNFTLDLAGK